MSNGVQTADRAVDAMFREYEALRAEIRLHQQQQNFTTIGSSAAILAFYVFRGFGLDSPDLIQRILLLGLSLFAMINGIAFADRSHRVKRIARYLHGYLRPRLIALLNGRHVWHWELFKKESHEEDSCNKKLLSLLDIFRLAVFWLVAVFLLVSYYQIAAKCCITFMEVLFLFLNFAVAIIFFLASREIEETSGANSDANLRKEIDKRSEEQMRDF